MLCKKMDLVYLYSAVQAKGSVFTVGRQKHDFYSGVFLCCVVRESVSFGWRNAGSFTIMV